MKNYLLDTSVVREIFLTDESEEKSSYVNSFIENELSSDEKDIFISSMTFLELFDGVIKLTSLEEDYEDSNKGAEYAKITLENCVNIQNIIGEDHIISLDVPVISEWAFLLSLNAKLYSNEYIKKDNKDLINAAICNYYGFQYVTTEYLRFSDVNGLLILPYNPESSTP